MNNAEKAWNGKFPLFVIFFLDLSVIIIIYDKENCILTSFQSLHLQTSNISGWKRIYFLSKYHLIEDYETFQQPKANKLLIIHNLWSALKGKGLKFSSTL